MPDAAGAHATIRLATPDDVESLDGVTALDVADHDRVLGGIPCPIVRFRGDRPPDGSSAE